MCLLGSVLLDPGVIGDLRVTPEMFYRAAHGLLYRRMSALYERSGVVDVVELVQVMRDAGELSSAGGGIDEDAIVRLASAVPSARNWERYAGIVVEKARLRRALDACLTGASEIYARGDEPDAVLAEIEAETAEANRYGRWDDGDDGPIGSEIAATLARLEAGERAEAIRTGFADLDRAVLGLVPGSLAVLAARPSMGKTAVALQIALQIAQGGPVTSRAPAWDPEPVGFLSLEMSREEIAGRWLAMASGVDGMRIRDASVGVQELGQVRAAAERLARLPLPVAELYGATIGRVRSEAMRMRRAYGVRVLVVDYLQLVTAPGRSNRAQEVGAVSRGLKALARELGVAVLALAQLNRESVKREGHWPRMDDLRDCGEIEQDADMIALLHRPAYYHRKGTPEDMAWRRDNPQLYNARTGTSTLFVDVAKQRNGGVGTERLVWEDRSARCFDWDG